MYTNYNISIVSTNQIMQTVVILLNLKILKSKKQATTCKNIFTNKLINVYYKVQI